MTNRGEGGLPRLALASLLGIAGSLCFIFFDRKSIWTDEGFRMLVMDGGRTWSQQLAARDFASYRDVLLAVGPTAYQPLYYLLGNAIFSATGHASDVSLKLFNIFLLGVSIAGILRLFRAWAPGPKLFLTALFTFNGYLILNIMQVREYPLYLSLVIWSTVFYFELYDGFNTLAPRRFWRLWAAYVFTGILGYYTHIFFILIFVAQAIFAFWRSKQAKGFAIRIYAALGAILLGALPWLLFLLRRFPGWSDPGDYSGGKAKTLAPLLQTLRAGFRNILKYHDSFTAALDKPMLIQVYLDFYAILVVIAILLALRNVIRRPRELDSRVLFCLLSVIVFVAFQSTYYFWKDSLSTWTRYFIGNYFGTIVLAAFAFQQLSEHLRSRPAQFRRMALAAVIGVTSLASALQLYNYYRYPYVDTALRPTRNWDEVGRRLSTYVHPSDTILYYHPLQGWTLSPHFKTPAPESSYWAAAYGTVPQTDVIWLLGTHVDIRLRDDSVSILEKNGYRKNPAVKLGVMADLIRFDRNSGLTAASVPNVKR